MKLHENIKKIALAAVCMLGIANAYRDPDENRMRNLFTNLPSSDWLASNNIAGLIIPTFSHFIYQLVNGPTPQYFRLGLPTIPAIPGGLNANYAAKNIIPYNLGLLYLLQAIFRDFGVGFTNIPQRFNNPIIHRFNNPIINLDDMKMGSKNKYVQPAVPPHKLAVDYYVKIRKVLDPTFTLPTTALGAPGVVTNATIAGMSAAQVAEIQKIAMEAAEKYTKLNPLDNDTARILHYVITLCLSILNEKQVNTGGTDYSSLCTKLAALFAQVR